MSNASKKYALVSVSDKTGVVAFATSLMDAGYTIISTGGTAKALEEGGVSVVPIQEITGNPESFDGRMKTISFEIESGILFDRDIPAHQKQAEELGIKPIDLVVCNLYPFEQTIARANVTEDEMIESIDVGGPTMVRAAAKNFRHVVVVVDPKDYESVGKSLAQSDVPLTTKKELAAKAFAHLSFYDSQIATFLKTTKFPAEATIPGRMAYQLRYGENPHQAGAVYHEPNTHSPLAHLTKLAGRELSFINVTDINAGLEAVRLFKEPCAVIIKHNNPCGIALGDTQAEALARAIEADPESAFGGVVITNKAFDEDCTKVIASFKDERRSNMDIVAAPIVTDEALATLKEIRKTMGVYSFGDIPSLQTGEMNIKFIWGGFIIQDADGDIEESFKAWEVVTKKSPTEQERNLAEMGWKFIARIKSNAVIVIDNKLPMTRGIGTGQTSRVRATKIALEQAGTQAEGGILISDSFFPFDDSVKLAAQHGITLVVQQGGSVNDKASIQAADEAGIAMILTHRRAFWH